MHRKKSTQACATLTSMETVKMENLAVIVIAYNEEKNIGDCLGSVASIANEIILVDSFSQDDTVKIAHNYTDKIFQRHWTGFADQKQFALDQATSKWVLNLDADERVSPELSAEIADLLAGQPQFEGFRIPRKSYFLGKWIRHCGWYPGYQVRLFLREKTRVSQSNVHEGFIVGGAIGILSQNIIHFSHPTIEESFRKMVVYSSLEALDRLERKQARWYHFIGNPLAEFFKKYIAQKGFLDGIHGLILSMIAATLKMMLYMRIWEKQRQRSTSVSK
ncbi:glycosyltransferase family 2 protein [candidate division KSB1 bacterium]|nr:glycosyltransferase family 2 protein [candidate division KSB1 bacterium]